MSQYQSDPSAQQKAQDFARIWFEGDGFTDIAQAICTGTTLTDAQLDRLQDTMKTPEGVVLRACFFTIYAPPDGEFEQIGLQILKKFTEDFTDSDVMDCDGDRAILQNVLSKTALNLTERGDKDHALGEIRNHLAQIERLEAGMKAVMDTLKTPRL